MTPSPDDVREARDRVLAAEPFAHAGRLSRLLRYLVDRALAGEGDQLKEYVLGVEVFDRGERFDPRLDSIVRVEARRLRARLDEYYRGPGKTDAVVIAVPRGSYAPVFTISPGIAAPVGRAGDLTVARPGRRIGRSWLAASMAAIVLVGIAVWVVWRPAVGPVTPTHASSVRSVAVLPFAHFSGDAADDRLAARITDRVTTELARVGTLSVVSATSARQFGVDRPLRDVARALGVRFVIEGSVHASDNLVRIEARFVDAQIDRKVWVGSYEGALSELTALERRIADEASRAIVAREAQ
ncbi:MAG: hypothetical protein ACT4QD_27230 [Acidobacteriota bacterium]